jgi:GNAT superfamily N-acetyltransferase
MSEDGFWLRGDASAWIAVQPEARGGGIGRNLAERIEAFAQLHDVRTLRARVLDRHLKTAEPFLVRRGFQDVEHDVTSVQEVAAADLSQVEAQVAAVHRQGIVIAAFSEIDTERNRRELYRAACLIERDMPTTEEWDDPPFDIWERDWFHAPGVLTDAIFVARDGEQIVGIGSIELRPDGDAEVGETGVVHSHRRRGIARALKLLVSGYARDHSIARIYTENNEVNAGMLKLNRDLGFRPGHKVVAFGMRLERGRLTASS